MFPPLYAPQRQSQDPPPEPNGRPGAWDQLIGFLEPKITRPLPDETPYLVVYRDKTYPLRSTLIEEGEQYVPGIDLAVPFTRMSGKLPKGILPPFAGSALVKHVSSKHEPLAMRITGYIEVNDVVELNLWGYGSVLCLGPLTDWEEPDDEPGDTDSSVKAIQAMLLQGNQTVI